MIAMGEWFAPTRLGGVTAYGFAALSCGVAWITTKRDSQGSWPAAWLTVVETILFLDAIFNWRWILHRMLVNLAVNRDVYASRHEPQRIALVVLLGLLLLGLFLTLRVYRGRRGAVVALSGVLLSIAAWLAEVVSLHRMDHLLHAPAGGLMVVAWVWIFACLLTSAGILADARHAKLRSAERCFPEDQGRRGASPHS